MRRIAQRIILPVAAVGLLWSCTARRPAPSGGGLRVASLAPNLTEIVCALGGEKLLVGRSSACNHPPEIVARVPVVGDFGAPSIERLLAAQPTLVLEVDLADESIGGQIDRLGIRRLRVACRGLYDIPEAIRQVGGAMGLEDRAGPLADELERQIAALRRESAALTNRPAVFVEIWGDPLTTAGKGSFVSDLVYLAGGRNIADEAGTDYFQVSPEWVVARNPEVMLCLYMADKTDTRQQVLTRPGWAGVTAVRTGRVRGGLNNDLLLRPGPRVLEGVRALRAAIGAPGQTP